MHTWSQPKHFKKLTSFVFPCSLHYSPQTFILISNLVHYHFQMTARKNPHLYDPCQVTTGASKMSLEGWNEGDKSLLPDLSGNFFLQDPSLTITDLQPSSRFREAQAHKHNTSLASPLERDLHGFLAMIFKTLIQEQIFY